MKSDDFPDEIVKMNKKSIKHLEKDNKKLFDRFYCIVDKKKFKEEYQNPFTLPFENKIHLIGKNKEKEEFINKKIINDEVFNSSNELLKDMTKELTIRPYKNIIHIGVHKSNKHKIKYSKNTLLEKFKEIIIKLTKYLKYIYGVTLSEILKEYKLPKICYTFRYTRELIYAIKTKKLDLCNKILDNHKYIVLDYDYYYLTPLHWAVKKNFYQIIPKLIEYGSFLNFQDFIGETPLHIGVKKNYYECVTLLLVNMASPFIKDKDGKMPIDMTKDFQMKILLENIMKIHYLSLFKNYTNQFEIINKQFTLLIVNEFSMQLDKDIFLYFKEREYAFSKKKNRKYL
jgi:ankyrin repeat protein